MALSFAKDQGKAPKKVKPVEVLPDEIEEEAPVEEEEVHEDPEDDEGFVAVEETTEEPEELEEAPEEAEADEGVEYEVADYNEDGVQLTATAEHTQSGELVETLHNESTFTPIDVPEIHSTVSVGVGATINIGDYNGVKLHVTVKRPCAVGDEEAAYKFAAQFAGEKLEELHNTYIDLEG